MGLFIGSNVWIGSFSFLLEIFNVTILNIIINVVFYK